MRLLCLLALLFLAAGATAQVTTSVGAVLPLSDFGQTGPETTDGFAKPGFAALLYFDAPFAIEGTRGFSFGGTIGALVFPSDSEALFSETSDFPQPPDGVQVQRDVGSWVTVPMLLGFRYEWGPNRDLAFIWAGKAGVGITHAPGVTYEVGGARSFRYERDGGLAASFGTSAGMAVSLFDRLELGAHALWLGTPTFTVDETVSSDTPPTTTEVELKRPVAALTLTVGYRL